MEGFSITTQGVRGGKTKTKKVGYTLIELRHDQDRIVVDDFSGQGNTYQKRELQEITIIQNGKILFQGDKYELFNVLKNKK